MRFRFRHTCAVFIVLLGIAPLSLAQPTVSTEYYAIYGNSATALAQEVKAKGPRGFAGLTDSEIFYDFDTRTINGRCRATRFRIRTSISYTMPEWANLTSADPELQARWKVWFDALERHEQSHGELVRQTHNNLNRRFLAVGARDNCSQVSTSIREIYDDEALLASRAHSSYDQQTDHGASEGASLGVIFGDNHRAEFADNRSGGGTLIWWFLGTLIAGLWLLRR